jgi:hypothetical protein
MSARVDHRAVLARRPWRSALMNRRPNALVIASLMVPTVVGRINGKLRFSGGDAQVLSGYMVHR